MKNKVLQVFILFMVFILGGLVMFGITKLTSKSTAKSTEVSCHACPETVIVEDGNLSAAVEKVYNSSVMVKTNSKNKLVGSGSGFVYKVDDKYNYIITNHHVIKSGDGFKVVNYKDEELDAKLLGSDEYLDIAVLRIDSSNIDMIAKMGSSANVDIGDTLFTVGAPLGKDFMGTITKGILSGKNRIVNIEISSGNFLMDTIQTDASINSGNSGGPLCNINGEVIGVNSSKLVGDGIEGMGFAIPIDRVVEVLSYLEQGKEIIRPYLGIQMTDISTLYDSRNNINIEFNTDIKNGIVITYVEEGKAAYNAGLKKGDIIISVNDELVTDTLYFRYLLYKYNIGDDIKIKYYRNNKLEEVVLKLS